MADLTGYSALTVRQVVERLEVFTGLETQNRYEILAPDGASLMFAHEESGFLSRQFLRNHRPLNLYIVEPDGSPALTASRGFFFFLSHMHVHGADGRAVGSVHRQLTFLKRRFSLETPAMQIASVEGPLFKPNTFMITRDGGEVARITKQWGGVLREAFSKADTFNVEFSTPHDQDFSLLVLATALVIDLEFFEKKGRR
jgi:uncharacterized protein YxjI